MADLVWAVVADGSASGREPPRRVLVGFRQGLLGSLAVMDGVLKERARRLAEVRLASLATRLAHVRGVAGAAERLVKRIDPLEAESLVAAAWLHDVGYSPSVRSTGCHAIDGAMFVRAEGFPALVVSLVAYHTGAVFEARERGLSKELADFAVPPEFLLDVLTCADMTTGPDGAPVRADDRLSEILSRYGDDDPVHRAITLSAPSLLAAVARVDALTG